MTTDEAKKATIERCARLAHEANRLWCLLLGDESQATWEHAEPWQKDSALKGVVAVLEGKTPRQLHESWMAEKIARVGVGRKEGQTHPCLKEYEQLPPEQKAKDHIFHLAVKVANDGPFRAWEIVKNAMVDAMVGEEYEHRYLLQAVLKALHESTWRIHWFYLQSYSNQGLANDNEVVIQGTARAVAQALATHDMATGKPPRSIVEFGKALKELLAIPAKAESLIGVDQSKGMEALVAKMLPVVKNELYERGNSATCLPEDRHVAWALQKGLLAIADVLKVPSAAMQQGDKERMNIASHSLAMGPTSSPSRVMIAKAALEAKRNVMILFSDQAERLTFLKDILEPMNQGRGTTLYPVELGKGVSNRPIIHRVRPDDETFFDIHLLAGPDLVTAIAELPNIDMLLDLSLLFRHL